MKNKFYLLIMLAIATSMITSCATSRSRYGCPANPSAYHKPGRF